VCVIINDTSEEFDIENNPVINPQNLERWANHRAEGEIESAVMTREKGSPQGGRMADNQSSSQPRRSYTTKFDMGSFNGVPICPAPAKEAPVTGKK
jgi:hypothetical protein